MREFTKYDSIDKNEFYRVKIILLEFFMNLTLRSFFMALTLLLPLELAAQVTTTSIVGTVTDATGAVVAGAIVTATDVDRNQSKSAKTSNSGEYRIDFL